MDIWRTEGAPGWLAIAFTLIWRRTRGLGQTRPHMLVCGNFSNIQQCRSILLHQLTSQHSWR